MTVQGPHLSSPCEHLKEQIASKIWCYTSEICPTKKRVSREPFHFSELLPAYKWTECEIKTEAPAREPWGRAGSQNASASFIWDWSNKTAIKLETEKTDPLAYSCMEQKPVAGETLSNLKHIAWGEKQEYKYLPLFEPTSVLNAGNKLLYST